MDRSGWDLVTTPAQLRALTGDPVPRVAAKVRDRLHEMDRRFLAASPFWLLATTGADGSGNVSPKGDPAGAVLVLDERTLVLPDRLGNRRVDGLTDVLDGSDRVATVFVVPGRGDTLRVNGRATVVRDAPFFDALQVRGHRPDLALVLDVEEVFFHCSKAFLRSALWDPCSWDPGAVPARAEIAHAVERPDDTLESLREYYGPSYVARLY